MTDHLYTFQPISAAERVSGNASFFLGRELTRTKKKIILKSQQKRSAAFPQGSRFLNTDEIHWSITLVDKAGYLSGLICMLQTRSKFKADSQTDQSSVPSECQHFFLHRDLINCFSFLKYSEDETRVLTALLCILTFYFSSVVRIL